MEASSDEESDCEIEEGGDGKAKIEEGEAKFDMLMAPEWDVDSFDGLEYYSSDDEPLSEDEDEEEAMEHTRIYKRQIIESKGFYVDPELRPICHYKRIRPMSLEWKGLDDMTYREFWEQMVYVCLQKLKQDKGLNVELVEVVSGNYRCGPRSKSYITFMAREKPDGPLVEYQAKSMFTFDRKLHPILCRPAPTPKP
ncbi:hypothetical protein V5N11_031730 [Cardamine amara subsp. amara]|uniref:Uncharacterized protein n=1 Tax=Cardamine amara subsp. amara TaxID=228776 RepID=A0ABD0ZHN3_CARAN